MAAIEKFLLESNFDHLMEWVMKDDPATGVKICQLLLENKEELFSTTTQFSAVGDAFNNPEAHVTPFFGAAHTVLGLPGFKTVPEDPTEGASMTPTAVPTGGIGTDVLWRQACDYSPSYSFPGWSTMLHFLQGLWGHIYDRAGDRPSDYGQYFKIEGDDFRKFALVPGHINSAPSPAN